MSINRRQVIKLLGATIILPSLTTNLKADLEPDPQDCAKVSIGPQGFFDRSFGFFRKTNNFSVVIESGDTVMIPMVTEKIEVTTNKQNLTRLDVIRKRTIVARDNIQRKLEKEQIGLLESINTTNGRISIFSANTSYDLLGVVDTMKKSLPTITDIIISEEAYEIFCVSDGRKIQRDYQRDYFVPYHYDGFKVYGSEFLSKNSVIAVDASNGDFVMPCHPEYSYDDLKGKLTAEINYGLAVLKKDKVAHGILPPLDKQKTSSKIAL